MLTTGTTAHSVDLESSLPVEMSDRHTSRTVGHQTCHQTPWYLRLKVPRLGADPEYAQRLSELVTAIPSVTQVRVNPAAKSLGIEFDVQHTSSQIATAKDMAIAALTQALEPTVAIETAASSHEDIDYWQRLGLPALGLALGLGTAFGLPIPGVVVAGVVLASAIPVFQRAAEGIQAEQQLNIDFLDGLAVALHTSQGRYFPPALMLGLIEGGEVIRDMTARGSERASLDLLDCLNGEVTVERDGQELRIAAKDIVTGDGVLVYPGDQIPVDATSCAVLPLSTNAVLRVNQFP